MSFQETASAFGAAKELPVALRHAEIVCNFIRNGLILRRSNEEVDGNQETVRLLRSQLRSKSQLRIIDADPLPLVKSKCEQPAIICAYEPARRSSVSVQPCPIHSCVLRG